jgi:hypothetical protein
MAQAPLTLRRWKRTEYERLVPLALPSTRLAVADLLS